MPCFFSFRVYQELVGPAAELFGVSLVLDDDGVVRVVEVGQPVAGQLGRLDRHGVSDDLEAM